MSTKNFVSYGDAETLFTGVGSKLSSLKSGLTNVADDVKLNTQDLTTPSRTKNLFKIQGESQTIAGVTYTVNNDGTITANGTASGNSVVAFYYSNNNDLNKNYIVSGCPSGGGVNSYKLQVFANDASEIIAQDIGDGASFNTSKPFSIRIVIYSGITVSNLVFDPMLRLATETDPTFAPYIPSVESRIEAVKSGVENVQDGLTNLITSYVINNGESIDINSTSFILIAKRTSNVSGQSVNAMYFTNEELFNTGDNQNPLTFTRIGNVFTVTNNNASAINLIVFLCSFVS